ncbi:hypothetical protein [Flammeovirga aprica]|uniref:Uncharacterized protein n=1 Tax=Flammeovirga aprica JL-4 TaxID=694437 RepID=A0A7X9RZN1_9BACT|nr:hypothetical protein [Flammeovirga aprica]NME71671.1 hypothetical protein [Flammeovirga aprica JL-4]
MNESVVIDSPYPSGGYYGFSLDMNENNIVVGAYRYNAYQGRVLLYQKESNKTWKDRTFSTTTLTSPKPTTNEYLGHEVRMDDNAIVTGALGYNNWQGRLYVYNLSENPFTASTVTPDAILEVENGGDYQVGIHVAIDNNIIIATDYGNESKGTIHVFKKEENTLWENSFEAFSITENTLKEKDYFGADLEVDNDEILIGSSQGGNAGLGKAYHYKIHTDSAELIDIYETDLVDQDDHFGASVHFTEQQVLVSTMSNREYPFFSFSRTVIEDDKVTDLESDLTTNRPRLLSSDPKYGIQNKIEFDNLNAKTFKFKIIDIDGGTLKEGTLSTSGIIMINQKLSGINIIQLYDNETVHNYKFLR